MLKPHLSKGRVTLEKAEWYHIEMELDTLWNEVLIHFNLTQWSHNRYKELLGVWNAIINDFKNEDIQAVYVVAPDKKVAKCARMFGFRDICYNGNGMVLMGMEI